MLAFISKCVADVRQWVNQNLTKTVSMCFSINKLDLKERFKIEMKKIPCVTVQQNGLDMVPQLKFDECQKQSTAILIVKKK